MTSIHLRGMTWDHPRGYDPLVACSAAYAKRTGVRITWDKRSLQDFESYPVEDLANRYDLIVIDHPHVGQVVREGCLVPFDDPERAGQRSELLAFSVGLSYQSYVHEGRLWALPLDAATQVQAWRPDKLPSAPERWDQVLDHARGGGVVLPLRSPHALMCVMTLAGNLGWEPGAPGRVFMDERYAVPALERLAALVPHLDPADFERDPIAALDALATDERFSCCPLAYGYISYARAGFRPARLAFADLPTVGAAGPVGSVLGGTGLAISARSDLRGEAQDFAYWVTSGDVQATLYSQHGGQAGHGKAWLDPAVDAAVNRFYSATRSTLEGAIVRPRHDGYMTFQHAGSEIIREGLQAGRPPASIAADLNELARGS